MTPATHVAVAAVVAGRIRSLGWALAACFGLHFALDFIYHFEQFFPLSVPGGWSYEKAMQALFAGLAAVTAPATLWALRRRPQAQFLAGYALLMCALPFETATRWRLIWAVLLTAAWWLLSPSADSRRWVLCGFASYLPDALRHWWPPLKKLHDAFHYTGSISMGDWVSLWARGRWNVGPNDRIYDPYYQIGYVIEILMEGAIFFGALYLLARDRQPLPPVAAQLPSRD
jgi:hypothetical protein